MILMIIDNYFLYTTKKRGSVDNVLSIASEKELTNEE